MVWARSILGVEAIGTVVRYASGNERTYFTHPTLRQPSQAYEKYELAFTDQTYERLPGIPLAIESRYATNTRSENAFRIAPGEPDEELFQLPNVAAEDWPSMDN